MEAVHSLQLHSVASQKTAVFKVTTMKISNLTNSVFITKVKSKFWSAIVPAYNDNYTKHLNGLCGPRGEFRNVE
jgi:hypothetical protein